MLRSGFEDPGPGRGEVDLVGVFDEFALQEPEGEVGWGGETAAVEGGHEGGDFVVANAPLGGEDLAGSSGDEAATKAGPIAAHFAAAEASTTGGEDDEADAREIEGGDVACEEDAFFTTASEHEARAEAGAFLTLDDEPVAGEVEGARLCPQEGKEARAVWV